MSAEVRVCWVDMFNYFTTIWDIIWQIIEGLCGFFFNDNIDIVESRLSCNNLVVTYIFYDW